MVFEARMIYPLERLNPYALLVFTLVIGGVIGCEG